MRVALLFLFLAISAEGFRFNPQPSFKDQEDTVELRAEQLVGYISSRNAELFAYSFINGGVLNLDVSGAAPYVGPIAIREYLTTLFNTLSYLDTLLINFEISGAPTKYGACKFDVLLMTEVDGCRVQLLQQHAISFVSPTNLSVVQYDIYFDAAKLESQLDPLNCKNSTAVIAPTWPNQFYADLVVTIAGYGQDWKGSGKLYYNWDIICQRSIFNDFCMPLFTTDYSSSPFMNFSCSYIILGTTTYFVNITDSNSCCILTPDGVPPENPNFPRNLDFNKRTIYNGPTGPLVANEFGIAAPPPFGPWFYWATPNTDIPLAFEGPVPIVGPTTIHYVTYNVVPDNPADSYCNIPLIQTCTKPCPDTQPSYTPTHPFHAVPTL